MNGWGGFVGRCIFPSIAALAAGILMPTTAQADGPVDEQKFVERARQLPMYVLPNGRYSTDDDILAGGYRACAVMDQYPTDPMTAARVYYNGGNTIDGKITDDGLSFMRDASLFLCYRHSGEFMPI